MHRNQRDTEMFANIRTKAANKRIRMSNLYPTSWY